MFFSAKHSTSNLNNSKSNICCSKPSTGQQQPSKTTTLSSVNDVKGLLQGTELHLTESSGTSITALVFCYTACNNSWVADSLAVRLGLQGTILKLTVKFIKREELTDTKIVQSTEKPHEDQASKAFTVRPCVRETLNVGSNIIGFNSMQETNLHLALRDPERFGDLQIIFGQDVYHAMRPLLEYFRADERCSPFAVRWPKCCFLWYDMESYVAYKQVDPRSAADDRAHEIFGTMIFHSGQINDVCILCAEDKIQLPENYVLSLVQVKCLKKRLSRILIDIYARTISEYLEKCYLTTVPDAHIIDQRSGKQWYLPHHPVINPNKLGKCVG